MFNKYVVITLLFVVNSPSFAGTLLPITIQTPQYSIAASPTKPPIQLNKIHSWTISIKDTAGRPIQGLQFSVQGGMPAHQHGFPTQPLLIGEPNPGKYIIDGLKFNMYGKWQIELIDSGLNPQFHHIIEIDVDHANSN